MPLQVLLIEDSLGDVRLTREAFRKAKMPNSLHVVSDGIEAMAFLRKEGAYAGVPRPDLILLDLNLPGMDGREVLALIKEDEDLKVIPVIVLTTSTAAEDIAKVYQLQANCYLTKPSELDAFEVLIKTVNDFWLRMIRLPQQRPAGAPTKKQITTLLLVEDNAGDARLLREMFNEHGANSTELVHVQRLDEAELYLSQHTVDIVLLDLGLPDSQGLDAVRRVRGAAPHIPLVVLTGHDDETQASLALQEGAQDYLIKGQIETRGLMRALRYAVERKAMEEELFTETERAQVTLNSIGDAVACTDMAGNITFLNFVAEKMTGWTWKEAEGQSLCDVLPILNAVNHEVIADPFGIGTGTIAPPHCILVRRDGVEISIENSVAPIHNRDGRASGAVIVFRDVRAALAMALEMTHAAQHDFLTGLPNRLLLSDRLNQAIALAARHKKRVAVLFLDLDQFKHINDSLGHPVGDKLLQSVAKRLVDCVRGSDTVSRQGGDEFIVLLSEVERSEDPALTARRMLQSVAEVHHLDEQDLYINASIGVSVYPDDLDADTLIKNADTAMYQAKDSGRRTYKFFMPAMNARAVERQSIEESLRRAIERDEFALHYQPKIDLRTGSIAGSEALIRWEHPTRGMMAPAQFIPVAEDCGLILPIGRWVLREACKQAQTWADAGLDPGTIAVNVSAMEFEDDDFLDGVFAILNETGLDPQLLEIELTESVLMRRVESMASILQALRARGIQISIDDFGTGYSSLSYLRRFPIDALKIDQSFVRQIATGDDTTIVTAVINMARSLKLRVIAEGVETEEELAFLQRSQCDQAQGYLFSRPVPAEQFVKLLGGGIPAQAPTFLRAVGAHSSE
ncbi:MAG: EAL domain-containing protein [Chloroflexota bacterium]